MRTLVIFGTGGNAIDLHDIVEDMNAANKEEPIECVGFLDDNEKQWGKSIRGVKILGSLSSAKELRNVFFINGIGNQDNFWKREEIIKRVNIPDKKYMSLIHPSAFISRSAHIGVGTAIFPHVAIASDVKIGEHTTILPNAVINHNSVIGEYTYITSCVSISGYVKVGKACYIGTNSSIKQQISIGNNALVGM